VLPTLHEEVASVGISDVCVLMHWVLTIKAILRGLSIRTFNPRIQELILMKFDAVLCTGYYRADLVFVYILSNVTPGSHKVKIKV
jgi:hypothetical protein